MKYHVDVMRVCEDCILLNGWAIGNTPNAEVRFKVENSRREPVSFKFVNTTRDDVAQLYFKEKTDKNYGFDIRFPFVHKEKYYLTIASAGKTVCLEYDDVTVLKHVKAERSKIRKLKQLFSIANIRRTLGFVKTNGLRAFFTKLIHKIQNHTGRYNYNHWLSVTKPQPAELEQQKKAVFAQQPLFSIVIPAFQTPEKYLTALFDSILAQTYVNWEVCIADGSPKEQGIEDTVQKYAAADPRFQYICLGENKGIAGNTNAAIAMASGDYIVLADHDDTLTPDALYECALAINNHPGCDVLYSDEDKMDRAGCSFSMPHFKPDFNLDLLRSINYICHLFVVKKELQSTVGGFRPEFDGAQDYDFIFRCVEQAQSVHHIPKVLYHWRSHRDSTANNPQSKLYAFDAGGKAIQAHYERMGIAVEKVEKGVEYGVYHTVFVLKEQPLVSIIVANKDHAADLDTLIASLVERMTYQNWEMIIVENNSTQSETFEFYDKIQAKHANIQVVTWEREFNYSAINNYGASFAKGAYLLLLNNDVKVISPNLMEEMLGYCQRDDVGIVGARLLYDDNTIQHAGVILCLGGVAGHAFTGLHQAENTYFHRAMCAQDYSAVTAACMMTKRTVFDQVGGLNESMAVAFNDIDFCMKVREKGYLVVYNPYAQLYHYESKSRGLEDTPEKLERFHNEVKTFAQRWGKVLKEGDPYYNPNLTLRRGDFSLRDLRYEKIGEPFPLGIKF